MSGPVDGMGRDLLVLAGARSGLDPDASASVSGGDGGDPGVDALDGIDARIDEAERLLSALRGQRERETLRLARVGRAVERALGRRLDGAGLDTLCRLLRERTASRPAPGAGVLGYFDTDTDKGETR